MEKLKVFCLNCKIETNHRVVGEHIQEFSNEEFYFEYKYQIIECLGCEAISFRKESFDRDAYDYQTESHIIEVELFPGRDVHYRVIKNYFHAPDKVQHVYKEAINAFNNNLPVLCAAGLRAVIEGICNEEGLNIEESNNEGKITKKEIWGLEKKIARLFSSGYLTKQHAQTLHELRFMGNEAVHQLDPPSTKALLLAIEIIEHTLDNLYEIGVKAFNLQRGRKRKSQDKG
jgi:hypothetical protein